MPFMPPPPSWAARRDHDAGSTTLKLIGRAVLAVSIGAIDPLTRQCAGTPPVVSTHDGADNVTLRTGSPIADGGTDVPSRSVVQSAVVMVLRARSVTVAAAELVAWSLGAGAAVTSAIATNTAPSAPVILRNMCSSSPRVPCEWPRSDPSAPPWR
jgi:hypothetical protein